MSAVQGGFIVLSLGSHCGKPQSQNACSPQLEEEEHHGKMYQQLYKLYARSNNNMNLGSMQRHWDALSMGLSLSLALSLSLSRSLSLTLFPSLCLRWLG